MDEALTERVAKLEDIVWNFVKTVHENCLKTYREVLTVPLALRKLGTVLETFRPLDTEGIKLCGKRPFLLHSIQLKGSLNQGYVRLCVQRFCREAEALVYWPRIYLEPKWPSWEYKLIGAEMSLLEGSQEVGSGGRIQLSQWCSELVLSPATMETLWVLIDSATK